MRICRAVPRPFEDKELHPLVAVMLTSCAFALPFHLVTGEAERLMIRPVKEARIVRPGHWQDVVGHTRCNGSPISLARAVTCIWCFFRLVAAQRKFLAKRDTVEIPTARVPFRSRAVRWLTITTCVT